MSRGLSKPSLKDYLSTGKVIIGESNEESDTTIINADINSSGKRIDIDKLVELLSTDDSNTWGPIFRAGAEIKNEKTDLSELREFFRTMDRVKFTLYILENVKSNMRIIRSSVQIREPFLLFLLWDDAGVASVYSTGETLIL